ncbi:MAG TPA: UDP-N-acetylmuramoyl-L-alanine--D-glutamate ligase [Desulfobacteraceae bacterium]|nr:UDP-N-acetylmuramoyl-L-alanine--D-glutamate ligase [Desulfobacteraceae bacterium]HPJ66913.1 UDP-N-acetylmuramoyl-L-alanine--D-glutamate ligase [Desulfobacteraceae bacterium]HPQ27605.1 UDP-N-acetylmuramoyl-L-alanine--D-glutamate ligase [Desulfobacteraceae bacterium]
MKTLPTFGGIQYTKFLIVGLGISGLWMARLLGKKGAEITVSELRPETDLDADLCREIRDLGANLETGGHNEDSFFKSQMIIISPGVPHDSEILLKAKKRNIPVIGELEFASRMIDTPIIAVTGTNGKSTVTAFLGNLLENAGLEVFVGGNIGTPLAAYAASEKKADYLVIEASSFQLDTIETFCPFVSVILNISPDHLDRYPSYEAYVQSKLKIFKNQVQGQYAIFNDEDENLHSQRLDSGVSVLLYGKEKSKGRHAFIENDRIIACIDEEKSESFSLRSFNLPGLHNLENLLAAVIVGQVLEIDISVIQKTINEFKGLQNRLEYVGEINGVMFYNDSKATNIDSAVRAISSFDHPLVLIAGGRHKGSDYDPLVEAANTNVKAAVLIGEAKELLAESFKGIIPCKTADDMFRAVSMAFSMAKPGDIVLLAPACSSFDMFSDYSQRGMVYRTAVERLSRG